MHNFHLYPRYHSILTIDKQSTEMLSLLGGTLTCFFSPAVQLPLDLQVAHPFFQDRRMVWQPRPWRLLFECRAESNFRQDLKVLLLPWTRVRTDFLQEKLWQTRDTVRQAISDCPNLVILHTSR